MDSIPEETFFHLLSVEGDTRPMSMRGACWLFAGVFVGLAVLTMLVAGSSGLWLALPAVPFAAFGAIGTIHHHRQMLRWKRLANHA